MNDKRLYAIRGAICSLNTEKDIDNRVKELFDQIRIENSFNIEDIVSIQFTITPDLTKKNPCASLRQMCSIPNVPLFCSEEANIEGMLPNVIRVLITLYMDKKGKSVYLNGAEKLRPDLAK